MPAIQVSFDLPSGSHMVVTFYNEADAKYLMDAVKAWAPRFSMPLPVLVKLQTA